MKIKFIIGVFCSIIFNYTYAQINESDTVRYQLKASISGNRQSGNVNVSVLRSKIDFSLRLSNAFVFKTQNATLYQAFSNYKADNDLFSRNYLYYKVHNKIYPYGIAYFSTNFRRKIDFRYFAGVGVTYQLLNKKYHTIKASLNAVYETTKFNARQFNFEEYNGSNQIALWRNTVYVAGSHLIFVENNKIKIFYGAYYQPSLAKLNNYRTQIDIGAEIPAWKGLSIGLLFTSLHESIVPLKLKTEDKIITFGLSYTLRKS